jgi:NAD(P)-dependent dehydrogenase (short-subunit alcohol dehydrogenase family)
MSPSYDFSGQFALVTGAGAGMGLDTARAFAEAGAAIVLADVNEEALGAATDGLTAAGHRALGLTKSAALEYAPRGIRINAVCPGTIETPMVADMIAKGELTVADAEAGQPIGRLGRGDEIAAAVLWLCSPGASLVVAVALPVDGGYTAR